MFRPDGRFQTHLTGDPSVAGEWFEIGIGAVMDMTLFELLRGLAAN
jgi:hypothetical protein